MIKNQLFFFDGNHCFDPQACFVKNEIFCGYHLERIFYPLINCPAQFFEPFLNLLNEFIDISIKNGGWGIDSIRKQLEITKQVIIVREPTSSEIVCYIRHDLYTDVPFMPHAFGRYRFKKLNVKGFVNKVIDKVMLEEVKLTPLINNYSPKLILRTFSAELYYNEIKFFGNLHPNILIFYERLNVAIRTILKRLPIKNHMEAKALFKDEVLLWDLMPYPNITQQQLMEMLREPIKITINLRKFSILENTEYNNSLLAAKIVMCAKVIYKRITPFKYRKIIINLLNRYHSNDTHHSFFGAKIPAFKGCLTCESIGNSKNQIINDFFYGAVSSGNAFIFCRDWSY